jgi:uncharacterized protein (TIGR00369 family)
MVIALEDEKELRPEYSNCFVCGQGNTRGLKLELKNAGGTAAANFTPDRSLEGYDGVVHGGIVSALLDEVMVWSAFYTTGFHAVTAELTVRFVRPLRVGVASRVLGSVRENKGRLILTEASLEDESGNILAKAEGKLFSVKAKAGP